MSFDKLVAHFQDRKVFPIQIDEIVTWLTQHGFQDEIRFYPVDMDAKILRGVMSRYTRHEGVYTLPVLVTEIEYPKRANICWERMICCKELMHLFDSKSEETRTQKEIIELTSALTSPVEVNFGEDFFAEHMAIFKALLLLAPIKIVEQMREHYSNGTKKPYDIALFFRIPEHYVSILFSPAYKTVADIYLALNNHA